MKKLSFWQILVVIFFGLVCVDLFYLSREVIYRSASQGDEYNATLEIRLCYSTSIDVDHCRSLKAPNAETPKKSFICQLQDRLDCYTKGFREKRASEMLFEFRNCNISDWAQVRNATNGASKSGQDLLLFNGYVCVNHKFDVHEKRSASLFFISSRKMQPFDVYITYARDYANDGKYKTKIKHLFERVCWVDENVNENTNESTNESANESQPEASYKCTETDKRIVFEIEYFSAKHLEYPYTTDCVHRTDSDHRPILQQDCYEECVKKEQKYHLFTYDESAEFTLEYHKTPELEKLVDKCADLCQQEDCQATGIFIEDIYEKRDWEENEEKEEETSQVILSLDQDDYRTEAVPLFGKPRLVWMIVAFVSHFFGLNFYQLSMKSANLYRFYNFATIGSKRKKQNKRLIKVTAAVTLLALGLALALEKILFDFGRETNMTFLRKDSIEDRNVSVSVCFSICAIIKHEFRPNGEFNSQSDSCTEEDLVQKWSIGDLDRFTWNASDFKRRASMRTNARFYPIRQDDFQIPHFFRALKKCFLIYYESKNYWPHYPLQRYSRIYINITGDVPYAHFYLEDGHSYPAVDAEPTRFSVLHWVQLNRRRPRDGCVEYRRVFGSSKDELIRHCVIAEAVKRNNRIPAEVTLLPDDQDAQSGLQYFSLKFNSDPALFKELSEACKQNYEKPGCIASETHLTYQDLYKGPDNITVNLTPFLYETRPFEDENGLIVVNRIISFLLILTGFSVREFWNALISVYLFDLLSFYNRLSRFFYPALSSLFLLHFCLLAHSIVYHPMFEFSYNLHVAEIEPSSRLRFCFASKIDLRFNNYTLNDLNARTLNYSEIFESLLIYNDENRAVANLTMADYRIGSDSDYPRANPVWIGRQAGHQVNAPVLFIDDLKRNTYRIQGNNKTKRLLNVHYHRLQKLYAFTFSFANLNRSRETYTDKFFIYFSKAFSCDLDWDRAFHFGDYAFEYTILRRRYQDDYFVLKNFYSSAMSLIGLSKPIDDPAAYLESLRDAFIDEQYATTTLMPLYPNDAKDLPIKNRQFNYYIQFRSMASKRNEYDFTKNTEKIVFGQNFYKRAHQLNRITLNVKTGLMKFQENLRNRYRPVELFLHLVVLIAFWFRVDLISLPSSLTAAGPICKYFAVLLLYYVLLTLLGLFRLWFALARFLKFKND